MDAKQRELIRERLKKIIGNNLKVVRESAGDSNIKDAAEKIGVANQTMGRYESGERVPDIIDFVIFCKAYKIKDYSMLLDNELEIKQVAKPIEFEGLLNSKNNEGGIPDEKGKKNSNR